MTYLIKHITKLWNGRFIAILSIIILSIACSLSVSSNENIQSIKSIKDLSMSKLSSSNANIEFITTEYDNEVIECYSIGKSNIAVGLKNYINIYNLDGTFLYGIKFKSNSSYFLEYEGNDLYLYIHRSSECIKITGFEKPLLFYYINDTKYNNDYVLHKLNCVYNDFKDDSNVYKVKGINNTKLVRISEDNIQKVIYNSTSNVGLKIIVVVIGNIMFVFVISYNIIINNKQNK